jgi:hypothetical protein
LVQLKEGNISSYTYADNFQFHSVCLTAGEVGVLLALDVAFNSIGAINSKCFKGMLGIPKHLGKKLHNEDIIN